MSSGGVHPLPLGFNPQGTNYLRPLRPLRFMRAMVSSPISSGQLKRGSQPYLIPCGELPRRFSGTRLGKLSFQFSHPAFCSFTRQNIPFSSFKFPINFFNVFLCWAVRHIDAPFKLTTGLATTLHFFVHDVLLSFTHTARLSCLTGVKRLNARHPILHRWRSLGPFQFAGRDSRLVRFRGVIRFGCHYSPTAFKSGLPSGLPC